MIFHSSGSPPAVLIPIGDLEGVQIVYHNRLELRGTSNFPNLSTVIVWKNCAPDALSKFVVFFSHPRFFVAHRDFEAQKSHFLYEAWFVCSFQGAIGPNSDQDQSQGFFPGQLHRFKKSSWNFMSAQTKIWQLLSLCRALWSKVLACKARGSGSKSHESQMICFSMAVFLMNKSPHMYNSCAVRTAVRVHRSVSQRWVIVIRVPHPLVFEVGGLEPIPLGPLEKCHSRSDPKQGCARELLLDKRHWSAWFIFKCCWLPFDGHQDESLNLPEPKVSPFDHQNVSRKVSCRSSAHNARTCGTRTGNFTGAHTRMSHEQLLFISSDQSHVRWSQAVRVGSPLGNGCTQSQTDAPLTSSYRSVRSGTSFCCEARDSVWTHWNRARTEAVTPWKVSKNSFWEKSKPFLLCQTDEIPSETNTTVWSLSICFLKAGLCTEREGRLTRQTQRSCIRTSLQRRSVGFFAKSVTKGLFLQKRSHLFLSSLCASVKRKLKLWAFVKQAKTLFCCALSKITS